MALVVVLGTTGIVFSRQQRIDKANPAAGVAPRVNKDHWHAALGVYICDKFEPNVPNNNQDPYGIHTHGDGIIHIHPFVASAAGNNAKLKVFAKTVGMTIKTDALKFPGGKTYHDGDKCNGKAGEVQLFVNNNRVSGNPGEYKPNDRDLIVLAFAPKDADIPKIPPSAPNLDKLEDVAPTTTTTVPGATTTTAPGGTTTTTAAPASTTTTAKP
ncbi:MAG TPA: hypothetical protein VFA94_03835 [Acidimicrobiales bacterium]|nr:hypothetical protein [Acidimicrobiales bacterium]